MALPAQAWETLRSDYRNLRGINFVAEFPDLAGTTEFYGVASPTAMWHFYHQHAANAARIDAQLTWAKRCGFNAVRVFLSFPAWLHYRANPINNQNQFLVNLHDFVQRCHARQLYVMPVFWSDTAVHADRFRDPDFDAPVGGAGTQDSNLSYWHRDPGTAKMAEILGSSDDFAQSDAGVYVRECVETIPAGVASAVFLWDAMNEPFPLPDQEAWVAATLETIKSANAANGVTRQTTWSFYVTDRFPASVNLAAHADCDVISLHVYGHCLDVLDAHLYDAVHRTTSVTFGKPVICTEIGYPGIGMGYRDTVGYCRWDPGAGPNDPQGVPRPDLGPGEHGIGFMPWAFLIGYRDTSIGFDSNMPFQEGTGLFYHDGTCREVDAVDAFVQLALQQGVAATSLWQTPGNPGGGFPLVPKTSGTDYVDPWEQGAIGPELDDFSTLQVLLTAPAWFWQSPWWSTPTWSFSDLERVSRLLRVVADEGFLDVAGKASTANGNPVAARPPAHVDPVSTWPLVLPWPPANRQPASFREAFTQFRAASDLINLGPGTNNAYGQMLSDLEAVYPPPPGYPAQGWLRPFDLGDPYNGYFVAVVVEGFLQHFAAAVRQVYVPPAPAVARRGPG